MGQMDIAAIKVAREYSQDRKLMLPNELEQSFRNHSQSDKLSEILAAYEELSSRREISQKVFPGDDWGDPNRIRANGFVYRQVLLHRSIKLFEGAVKAAIDENLYSMVLNSRGHFETTASLGYFHRRLQSVKKGGITLTTLDRDLCVQLLGVRHASIPQAPDPKSILSLFEEADKSANISILRGTAKQYCMLKDSYEFLSEFCHPNFHSNSTAIEVDKSVPEFRFRHGQPMRDEEFKLIGYLPLSTSIFVAFYDLIPDLLPVGM
jgi:hypothetical protein